jgi:hypothetical protein
MSMRQKSSYFYQLDQHILEQVKTNPYIGLNISDDLKWSSHISIIRLHNLKSDTDIAHIEPL